MKSSFYSELSQMTSEASQALMEYEAGYKDNQIFDKIRAIGVACLDGTKLDASIVEDLGPRRRLDFQRAVFTLAETHLLSTRAGANVNISNAINNIMTSARTLQAEAQAKENKTEPAAQSTTDFRPPFVHPTRIKELRDLQNPSFDCSRLIRLLEELNIAFRGECYMATAMLVRAIVDHIPPIFGFRNFGEVTSNYKGAKSFKDSMLHLQNSLRPIADAHLHLQIRRRETLPTENQIDFRSDLDVLLGELIRVLKSS